MNHNKINNMKPVKWIIQRNLLAENCVTQLCEIFERNNIKYQQLDVIPFSDEVADLDMNYYNIIYGSVQFVNNLQRKYGTAIGVFYNQEDFSIQNYIEKWGNHMLNSDAIVTTFDELIQKDFTDESLWFIRPDADNKSFDGQVKTYAELKNWNKNLQTCDNIELNGQTKIIIAEPWAIAKEWRLYIVDGQIVASSKYREYMKLCKSATDIPKDMLEFAMQRISEYQPHNIFCMDIAFCGDSYYIIECGCINSCGFYQASIESIVLSITEYCSSNH